jgi:serine/threonine protein kinase
MSSAEKPALIKKDPETLYTVHELVGTGVFGNVYRGVTIETGQPVAIKMVDLEGTHDLCKTHRKISGISRPRSA